MRHFIFTIFILNLLVLNSQVKIPSCMEDDLEYHTYISCGFHTTIMKTTNGFQVFGARSSANGRNHLYYPTDITPVNGFNYEGEILHATLGDKGFETPRMFILTTEGLYTWGYPGTTISSLLASSNFRKITLPDNIQPSDIKKIEASYSGLIMLTNSGDVYVLGIDSSLFADGSTDIKIWHKANISNVKYISIASSVIFVYTHDGKYYTWGTNTFLGNSTGLQKRTQPTEMTPPFSGEPKMIVAGSYGVYFALGPDKRIYALGYNGEGQLGVGNQSNSSIWKNVKDHSKGNNQYLEDIIFVNTTNNHIDIYPGASSAISSDGTLYLWGYNGSLMISNAVPNNAPQPIPIIPSGFTPGSNQAVYVENGGHITPYVDFALKKYGYVGHLINGSMGNGLGSNTIGEYDLINTPEIEFCFIAELEVVVDCKEANFTLDVSESNYTVEWDFGDGTPIETTTNSHTNSHIYDQQGTYQVKVTINYGSNKQNIIEKTVIIEGIPQINIDRLEACGEVLLDSGTFPSGYTIQWTAPDGKIVTGKVTISGDYTLTVTSDQGCISTKVIPVIVNPLPQINIDRLEACGEVLLDSGTFPSGYTIQWTAPDGKIVTGKVTISGDYTLTVTSDQGCISTKVIPVIVNPLPQINIDRLEACGEVLLDSGTFPSGYTIQWTAPDGKIVTGKVTISGDYTLTVTSDQGCISTKVIPVIVNPLPQINIDRLEACGEVLLDSGTFPSGYTIQWTAPDGKIVTGKVTISGDYTLTVTSDQGCISTKVIPVIVNPLPQINIDRLEACGEVLLDSGTFPSGYTIQWTAPDGKIVTGKVTISGDYTLTVTSDQGCISTKVIPVIVNPLPQINIDRLEACGEVLLDSGTFPSGYTIQWTAPDGKIVTGKVTISGDYTLTVTSDQGCISTKVIPVIVNPLPQINIDRLEACGEVLLDSGTFPSGYTIQWTAPDGKIVTGKVTISGDYTLTVTSDQGCISTKVIPVIVNPLPQINIDRLEACGEVLLDSGTFPSGYTIQWTAPDGKIVTGKVTISGDYTLTVTSDQGCISTKVIPVIVNPLPQINIDRLEACGEVLLDSGTFPSGYTIQWTAPDGKIVTGKVTISGDYTLTVTSDQGCISTKVIPVIVNPLPQINIDRLEACGEVLLDSGTFPSGYTIQWTAPDGKIVTGKVTISGDYTLTVTSDQGCISTKVIPVIVNTPPVVKEASLTFCKVLPEGKTEFHLDQSYSQIVTNPNDYTIRFYPTRKDAETGNSKQELPLYYTGLTNSKTIYVRVESPTGCKSYTTLDLIVNQTIIEKVSDLIKCEENNGGAKFNLRNKDSEIQSLIGSKDYSLEYYTSLKDAGIGENKIKNITDFTNKNETLIIAKAIIPNQCSRYFTFKTITNKKPVITDVKIKNKDIEIIAKGAEPLEYSLDLINWQISSKFTDLASGIYKAYTRNIFGCISEYFVIDIISVPNAITPNGDGINDFWIIPELEPYPGSIIKVFNRNGKVIVDKIFYQNPVWDGSYLGRQVPTTNYWYNIILPNGRLLSGWISVRNYD